MKPNRWNILWGALLVAGGVLMLLGALNLVVSGAIWGAFFGALGVAFAFAFLASRENWWAAIPAGALLGLAALIAWAELGPQTRETWGATLFLGALGAGFWAVYLRDRENWWAIIPGGALLTIALFVGLAPVLEETALLAVFFFGLALTFVVLALVTTETGRMRWPIIPAGVLGVLGGLFALGAVEVLSALNYLWAAVAIAAGLYLLFRATGSRRRPGPRA
ncbi:Hypothetical Protein RradSPS_2809 (plasmid) [Rubrobacter radiotolerans]|uniref:Uncharacterized protein n=1 Tax=Rubrobacter radiotolerans TaxID=42256 RepID=A0A023X6N6_RUBRA|nr:hypothetical protein [Rubrobacter radiotolerans]AHY48092.1 Hypothetical Protein RradSPS_2809 [Rubrobacter radiotolerans]MDX5895367.1 hypothetical protein [Rubrobacter radiotolerans]SMC01713.1 conserved hypothetical protein [Rubrobacter radiotolerans DSM 5868]